MIPRNLLWSAGLAILALSCSGEEPTSSQGMDGEEGGGGGYTFPVTFTTVARGDVSETVALAGDVATMRRATLAFERGGRIDVVQGEAGDVVEEGQKMARLDSDVLTAELQAAHAALRAANAEVEFAKKELARAEAMEGAVSDAERDQWESEVRIREARMKQRSAEEGSLLARLRQGTLFAPFDGTIVERHLTLGSYANPGDPVFEILDLAHREVRIELPQAMAQKLQPGIAVEVHSSALPDGPIAARLDAVLPSAMSQSRTFTGLVRLPADADPQHRLMPGAFVEVRLIARQAQDALMVPQDALIETPEGTLIYAIEGEAPPKVRLVPVMVLARSGKGVAVAPFESGALKAEDRIVVTGTDNVFPGAPLLLHPHRDPATDDRAVLASPAEGE